MPNWCMNGLEITGPVVDVEHWLERIEHNVGSEYGLLGTFVVPDYNESGDNWYTANIAAWGTKWDVQLSDITESVALFTDDQGFASTSWQFETAWSPPCAWLQTMSGMWPSLTFSLWFEEWGMQFMGYMIAKDGKVVIRDKDFPDEEDTDTNGQLTDAYYQALEDRREQLIWAASEAYDKAMWDE